MKAVFLPSISPKSKLDSVESNSFHSVEKIGIVISANIDFFKIASKITLPGADSVDYILFFESPNAKGYALGFSEFQLPKGSQLFIENETGDSIYFHYVSKSDVDIKDFKPKSIWVSPFYVSVRVAKGSMMSKYNLVIDRIALNYKDGLKEY